MVKCDHFYLHDARYLLGMFSDSANNSNKFPEPLLVHPDAPPDAERVKNLPLPELPYGPYNENPGSPEVPYKPYTDKTQPGTPYKPYADI